MEPEFVVKGRRHDGTKEWKSWTAYTTVVNYRGMTLTFETNYIHPEQGEDGNGQVNAFTGLFTGHAGIPPSMFAANHYDIAEKEVLQVHTETVRDFLDNLKSEVGD